METKSVIIFCILMIIMSIAAVGMKDFKDMVIADEENWCGHSLHNPTNNSYAGTYSGGNCYYEQFGYYQTHKVCSGGFLGIGMSCYESSKPHTESYRKKDICVVLDTGEKC